MVCLAPIIGYKSSSSGALTMIRKEASVDRHSNPVPMIVPCNKCLPCRQMKAQEWALRAQHEQRFHRECSFVTLTYSDENLLYNSVDGVNFRPTLRYEDVQKFLKRLRKAGFQFKYLCAGEYGEKFGRPHFHLVFFGHVPLDCLVDFWGLGFVQCRLLNRNDSAGGYVAQYTAKKLISADLEPEQVPPFLRCSNGLGKQWFLVHWKHTVLRRFCTMNGFKKPIPRYYIKLLKKFAWSAYLRFRLATPIPTLADVFSLNQSELVFERAHRAQLSAYRLDRIRKYGNVLC